MKITPTESPIQLTSDQKRAYEAEQQKKLEAKAQEFLALLKEAEDKTGMTLKPIISYQEAGALATFKVIPHAKSKSGEENKEVLPKEKAK